MRVIAAILAVIAGVLTAPAEVEAQERRTLGFGRQFNNDYFGDGEDRWRSGSYTWSLVRGADWTGERPAAPFAIVDYRFRTEIIAPRRLNGTGSRDRRYAGIFSVGAHTHFARGPLDYSLGADVVFVGPQTRIADAQEWFHDLVDAPRMGVEQWQIGNHTRLHGTAELAWPVHLAGGRVLARPFLEGQAGVESLLRVGGDVLFGEIVQDDLLIRDGPTGHLTRAVEGPESGFAYVLGADWTRIEDSLYLPEGGRATLTEERQRLRAGIHWQIAPGMSFFYGATWLSEEFDEQDEGQVLGSLKLNFNF